MIMIDILQSFWDLCFYPLYQINVEDPFLGILCFMLIIAFVFNYLFYILDNLRRLGT